MSEEHQTGDVTLDSLAAMIKTGFDEVHSKFDDVDKRFENVDKRFDDLIGDMNKRFTEVHEKIEAVDASLRVEIKATREEMRQGFAKITPMLSDHEERLTKLEHEVLH